MKNAYPVLFFFCIVFSLVGWCGNASAHLAGGDDVVVGNYIVDFGYDPVYPAVGKPVSLSFNLADKKTERVLPFDYLVLSVTREPGSTILFSGNLAPTADNNALLTYTFGAPGSYSGAVQFYKGGRLLATTTVDIAVTSSAAIVVPTDMPAQSSPWRIIEIAALAAIIISFFVAKKRPINPPVK